MASDPKKQEKLIDLAKIWAIIEKNFIVITRDKARILPLLLFPIFMIMIFGFTSGNVPKHIPAAVVMYDHSPIALEITQAITDSQVLSVSRVVGTESEAKRLLDEGVVKAIVELPPNLGDDVAAGRQAKITVLIDKSDASVSSIAQSTLQGIVAQVSAQITQERIAGYQQGVAQAGQTLFAYASSFPDNYPTIVGATAEAGTGLVSLQQKFAASALALTEALPMPRLYVLPNTNTGFAAGSGNYTLNGTYLSIPPGYESTKGQIAAYEGYASAVGSVLAAVREANDAAAAGAAGFARQASPTVYQAAVLGPVATLDRFSAAPLTPLLQPLVYAEKDAYGSGKRAIDYLIPAIIALTIFQGAVMGMGRAIAGEKREGSLTRVFLTPTSNATIILGTLLFYILFEIFRSSFLILIAQSTFHVRIEGSLLSIFVIVLVYAGVSTAIGMVISTLAKTEQQYMGLSMLVSMPTIFLAGVFFPIQAMPKLFQTMAAFLPVTYAAEALRGVMVKGFSLWGVLTPVLILCLFLAVTVGVVFLVFKRDIE